MSVRIKQFQGTFCICQPKTAGSILSYTLLWPGVDTFKMQLVSVHVEPGIHIRTHFGVHVVFHRIFYEGNKQMRGNLDIADLSFFGNDKIKIITPDLLQVEEIGEETDIRRKQYVFP